MAKGSAAAFEAAGCDELVFVPPPPRRARPGCLPASVVVPQGCGISRSPGWTRPVS